MAELSDEQGEHRSAKLDARVERPVSELCAEFGKALTRRAFSPHLPPPRIGHFEVTAVIGTGGFGGVLRGWDPGLEREVAIKLCANNPEMDAAIVLSEARAIARLSAPNIVTVYECGTHAGRLFLVMEYVSGGSLYDYAINGEPRSWRELVEIFADVARGVAAAHKKGVVHGDLKPDNILIHEDLRPVVADFGLARIVGKPVLMPKAIGTRAYAAPEVVAGQVRDELSDQWSFFVALCHCIDRELPILDPEAQKVPSSDQKMLEAIRVWLGPSSLEAELPSALVDVLKVGLSLDPRDRFPDMRAVAAALDEVLVDDPVELREPLESDVAVVEPSAAPVPPSRRKMAGLAALGLSLGIALAGQAYLREAQDRARSPQEQARPNDDDHRSSGEEQLIAVIHATQTIDVDDDAAMFELYESWHAGWSKLHLSHPARAAELSLQIAGGLKERAPGAIMPARLAERAAEDLAIAGLWTQAVRAQEQAVDFYKSAQAPERENTAADCLESLRAQQMCDER